MPQREKTYLTRIIRYYPALSPNNLLSRFPFPGFLIVVKYYTRDCLYAGKKIGDYTPKV